MSPQDEKNEEGKQSEQPPEQPQKESATPRQEEPATEASATEKPAKEADPTEASSGKTSVSDPKFEDLQNRENKKGQEKKISFLYDIKLDVSIELGRAEIKVRDILSLEEGSIVELNRLAGDPVDIIVNNKMIARGEVIVIDDNFAVRVTDILTPTEIVNKLDSTY